MGEPRERAPHQVLAEPGSPARWRDHDATKRCVRLAWQWPKASRVADEAARVSREQMLRPLIDEVEIGIGGRLLDNKDALPQRQIGRASCRERV